MTDSVKEKLDSFFFDRIDYERKPDVPYDQRFFRLDPIKTLMEKLGNPHQQFPSIHVTGTKGKGSVSTYLNQLFVDSGKRTGVYSSPHIHSVCERYCLDGQPISEDRLLEVVEIIRPAVEFVDRITQSDPEFGSLTFFDLCTAAAFQLFQLEGIDVGIIEVGMGGRLDSTNIVNPTASVITNVSLDHIHQLGDTVEKIAYEKAGIIKDNRPVICGRMDEPEKTVVQKTSDENNSRVHFLGSDFQWRRPTDQSDGKLSLCSTTGNSIGLPIPKESYVADHQLDNISVAFQAYLTFCESHDLENPLNWQNSVQKAIRTTIPGRIEILSEEPLLVLDMAHNAASLRALSKTINDLEARKPNPPRKNKTLILAIAADKDLPAVISEIGPCFNHIIYTKFQSNPRSADPEILGKLHEEKSSEGRFASFEIQPDLEKAYQLGTECLEKGDTVVFAGSIFLVAEIKAMIEQQLPTATQKNLA